MVGGLSVIKATSVSGDTVDTFVQKGHNSSVSVFAVLHHGESSVRFSSLFNAGLHLNMASNGGITVVDGKDIVRHRIAAPWATDATGRRLPTRYSISGDDKTDIIQHVDTTDAVFPVVADPHVSLGLDGIKPIYKIRFTWTETNKINVKMDTSTNEAALSALCSAIPLTPARVACTVIGLLVYADLKKNVKSAIKNKKCLQVHYPVAPVVPTLISYDARTVKCSE
ncbi:hypothetical protein B0H63DRAFT_469953 [Podospora didyma]|uniref:Uncharacterized protein n=1 Tax=Podospora didyma TaxID=330526 RepID=A0AAE0U1R7_9PEZI|nr:hypothetical protein B0H63DRAFT_469953 [Podospora didyma]